jgi:V/A-type H+-transporting ATPase subunit E
MSEAERATAAGLETGGISSGVEALLQRLREEGVAAGRAEASRIVAEAERRAEWLAEQASAEAKLMREGARADAERFKKAGEEALRVAARDLVLELKSTLMRRFTNEVERLVSREMRDETFLQRLILEVAARAREDAGLRPSERVEILLPIDAIGIEDLRRKPEEFQQGTLAHFVLAATNELLREGVSFANSAEPGAGIQMRLVDRHVQIDLSDRAVAAFLLQHLQPRFRALLEGIVK